MDFQAMDTTTLQEKCSVAFQVQPKETLSDRYTFIPTSRIIDDLSSLGWGVVAAKEVRSKKNKGFQKHKLVFENPEVQFDKHLKGEAKPHLIITNSHDGLACFDLQFGVYRLVCQNGLIVGGETFQHFRIRHGGYNLTEVQEGVWEYVQNVPAIAEEVHQFKKIQLERDVKMQFAKDALDIRYPNKENKPVEPYSLLTIHREDDDRNDLWSVFNVVQENIMKAGRVGNNVVKSNVKGQRVKPINGIKMEMELNQDLWMLMANYYKNLK